MLEHICTCSHDTGRQQAPLRSNIFQSNSCEFTAPARQRRLDPWKWRANHYVSLLGRAVVFKASCTDPREDLTPELRVFSFYDKDAVALGHRLHNLSS
eukprot:symbB.v1.2.008368.t1/scaffold524.1/size192337/17